MIPEYERAAFRHVEANLVGLYRYYRYSSMDLNPFFQDFNLDLGVLLLQVHFVDCFCRLYCSVSC